LVKAAERGHLKVVESLLPRYKFADHRAVREIVENALHKAREKNCPEIVALLEAKCAAA